MKRALAILISTLMSVASVFSLIPLGMADDVPVTANVSAYITYNVVYTSVAFGSVSAGTSDNTPTSPTGANLNTTIDTNSDFKFTAEGTSFVSGSYSFGVGNLTIDTNTTVGNLSVGDSVAVGTTGNPATIDTNIPYTVTLLYQGFWLDIPSGQHAGDYTSTVTLVCSNV